MPNLSSSSCIHSFSATLEKESQRNIIFTIAIESCVTFKKSIKIKDL